MKITPASLWPAPLLLVAPWLGCTSASDGAQSAAEIPATSGTTATTVQEALDALAAQVSQLSQENAALRTRLDAAEALLGELAPLGEPLSYGGAGPVTLQQAFDASWTAEQAASTDLAALASTVEALGTDTSALHDDVEDLSEALDSTASQLNAAIDEVEAKLDAPRACPKGMKALDEWTCMDEVSREPDIFVFAMSTCTADGLRVCSLQETFRSCEFPNEEGTGPAFSELSPRDVPHWVGDSASQLPLFGEGPNQEIAGLALVGSLPAGYCDETHLASTTWKGENTTTTLFHFRCCMDRK